MTFLARWLTYPLKLGNHALDCSAWATQESRREFLRDVATIEKGFTLSLRQIYLSLSLRRYNLNRILLDIPFKTTFTWCIIENYTKLFDYTEKHH